MKWEVRTGKSGKKYIRVNGKALMCLVYNDGDCTTIEDAMVEQIVAAVNREVPVLVLEHVAAYDYNRHGIIAFISTKVQETVDAIRLLADKRKTYRIELYEE